MLQVEKGAARELASQLEEHGRLAGSGLSEQEQPVSGESPSPVVHLKQGRTVREPLLLPPCDEQQPVHRPCRLGRGKLDRHLETGQAVLPERLPQVLGIDVAKLVEQSTALTALPSDVEELGAGTEIDQGAVLILLQYR